MNKFDKSLRDKLEGHSSPYSDKVWTGIVSSLHPKQTNRRWIFFWITTGMLLLGLITVYLINKEPTKDSSTLNVEEVSSITDRDDDLSSKKRSLYSTEKATSESSLETATGLFEEAINTASLDMQGIEYNKENKENSTEIKSNKTNNTRVNNQNKSRNADDHDNDSVKSIENTENYTVVFIPSSTDLLDEPDDIQLNLASQKKKEPYLGLVEKLSPLKKLDGIGLAALSYEIREASISQEAIERVEKSCPQFSVFRPGFYFDFNYSVDYAIKSLTAKNIDFATYAFNRNDTESYSYSYTFSARVAYLDPSGFTAKLGLNYSEINEQLNYIDPEKQAYKTIIEIDSTFIEGEWKTTRDTTVSPIPGTGIVEQKNRYKTINIPISIAYEWRYNRRFSFFVEGGLQFNILFNKRGQILSPYLDNELVSFSDDSDSDIPVFNKRFSTGLMFNTGAIYHLNSTMDLYMSTGFRHHPGSLTVDDYPVQQKFSVFNVATGVRYKF